MKKLILILTICCIGFVLQAKEILNNNQTETLQIPIDKLTFYFKEFFNPTFVDYQLAETKVDSLVQVEKNFHIYLTENKNHNSAEIVTDIKDFKDLSQSNPYNYNLVMLITGELNAETKKSPIKPPLIFSQTLNGTIHWKIIMEPIDENSTQLTFQFISMEKQFKKSFINQFTKNLDNYYNYSIQKIYVLDHFKTNIVDFLQQHYKSDFRDVAPTKGN